MESRLLIAGDVEQVAGSESKQTRGVATLSVKKFTDVLPGKHIDARDKTHK